jgi:pimeloyl-ACP methyl ester carboxylesterase/DNA-binding CsgD family transcriptional regulator
MSRSSDLGPDGHSPEIRFCRAADGVRIAYTVFGSGPPLVMNAAWLFHLQYDWRSPVWSHYLRGLGEFATVIRYDERGYGLSDDDVVDLSLDARVSDLEAVVESAGLTSYALYGMSQAGPVVISHACRQPSRVTRLVLYGAHATPTRTLDDDQFFDTLVQLVRIGWQRPESTFRRVLTTSLIPTASEELRQWVDDHQPRTASPEVAIEAGLARRKADVTDMLGTICVPTLVLHCRGDRINDFSEGRLLASTIPDARFVALDSDNHVLLEDEPAWQEFLTEVERFLEPDRDLPVHVATPAEPLTAREREVLELAVEGLDNRAIADRLVVSVRTVERHFSNAYRKLGVSGRSARAAAVAHVLSR